MKTLADLSYDELLARAAAVGDLPQLRVDVSPLTEGGKRWWTKGEGLKKWATKLHPWTALYHEILQWADMTPAYAARIASAWYHDVFGHWPGEHSHKGKPAHGHRSVGGDGVEFGMVAVTANVWLRERANLFLLDGLPDLPDGEPMGDLDDDTLALLAALAELDIELDHTRSFDPNEHKRYPKGHPLAGRFRPMVDLLKMAIVDFKDGKGKGKDKHPFEKFTRPQLMNAAKARGIKLERGEDRDSIANKLLLDLAPLSKKPDLKADLKDNPAKLDDRDLRDLAAEFGIDHHGKTRAQLLAAIRRKKKAEEAAKALPAKELPPIPAMAKLDRMPVAKLRKLARDHGIPEAGVDRWDLAIDIRKKARAHEAAVEAAAKKQQFANLDKMPIGDLFLLARRHGVDAAELNRRELIAALKVELAPRGPGDASKFHVTAKGLESLQNAVEHGTIVKESTFAHGAIGDTRKRKYADGTELVWKRTNKVGQQDAEQLASLTARALGLQAPRVYRNHPNEINMEFVHGEVAMDHRKMLAMGWNVEDIPEELVSTKQGRMMGLLDQLIVNSDRHNANWMISEGGNLHPIDHGYTFGNRPGHKLRDAGKAQYVRSGFAKHYVESAQFGYAVHGWANNDLTKADVAKIRERLVALKADFAKLGRNDWHEFMLERLEAIGQHATGRKSQLLPSLVE